MCQGGEKRAREGMGGRVCRCVRGAGGEGMIFETIYFYFYV